MARLVRLAAAALACALATACAPATSDAPAADGPGHRPEPSEAPATTVVASPSVSTTPAPIATPPAPPPPARVVDVLAAPLRPGSLHPKNRELQARLRSAKAYGFLDVTDRFDENTREGVRLYQERTGLPVQALVDQQMWDRLVNETPAPSPQELANQVATRPYVIAAVPALVKEAQHRLSQLGLYAGPVDGWLSESVGAAASEFQRREQLPVDGVIDQRAWERLSAKTRNPTVAEIGAKPAPPLNQVLDPRCRNRPGRVVCISMGQKLGTYLVDGQPVTSWVGRFGSPEYPSRPGAFRIHTKRWTTVSTIFGERFPMPYAMFYDNGKAIHFSFDFLREGYDGASHGCMNMLDYETIKWLYDQLRVGDRVIVYEG